MVNRSMPERLGKRLTILRPPSENEVDDAGQPLSEYVPVTTVWSSIEPLRGKEFFEADKDNSQVTTRIRIRYRKGINDAMIGRLPDGAEFRFKYIINPEHANKELQIMAEAI